MAEQKKSWFKTNILEKVTVGMLLVLISGGTAYYLANERRIDGIEKIVEQQTFSSFDMKEQTEGYIRSTYTERKMTDAMIEMIDRYQVFTQTADTTNATFIKYFQVMELHRLRDEAILSFIRDNDSLRKAFQIEVFEKIEVIDNNIFSGKNANELTLKEIRKLKSLENTN